jgi:hypothetical protein
MPGIVPVPYARPAQMRAAAPPTGLHRAANAERRSPDQDPPTRSLIFNTHTTE